MSGEGTTERFAFTRLGTFDRLFGAFRRAVDPDEKFVVVFRLAALVVIPIGELAKTSEVAGFGREGHQQWAGLRARGINEDRLVGSMPIVEDLVGAFNGCFVLRH